MIVGNRHAGFWLYRHPKNIEAVSDGLLAVREFKFKPANSDRLHQSTISFAERLGARESQARRYQSRNPPLLKTFKVYGNDSDPPTTYSAWTGAGAYSSPRSDPQSSAA